MHFSTLFSATGLVQVALAGYVLQDDYMSGNFYDNFEFFTAPDPTHGFVQYVDQSTAQSMNLLNASAGTGVGWGVDTVNKDPNGRASVRLTSKKVYNKGLVVIDVEHMPVGCGTWPAFWMVGPNWPNAGEIDIIEGVHNQETNSITLHTGAGCAVGKDTGAFAGEVVTGDCDIKAPGQGENQGCSIKQQDTNSYGAGLNNNGGGVFATEWTSEAISVWFFPRGDATADALGENPDPSSWGKPAARFQKSACDIDSFFKDQQIVFDTTFCGDWAGRTWGDSCAAQTGVQTCNDFVQNNPKAFSNAFWTVNALKVYTNDGSASQQPPSSGQSEKPTQKPTLSEPGNGPVTSDQPFTSDAPFPTGAPAEPTPAFPSSDAPFPSSSGFESPPIVDPTEVPSEPPITTTPVPGPSDVPSTLVTRTRTRHGGGPGGPGGQNGRPTQGLQGAQLEDAAPAPSAKAKRLGGFTWPAADPESNPSKTAEPPSPAADTSKAPGASPTAGTPEPAAPSPSTVDAGVPTSGFAPPKTTGIVPGTTGLGSVDFNTVPTFSATVPVGVPKPTDDDPVGTPKPTGEAPANKPVAPPVAPAPSDVGAVPTNKPAAPPVAPAPSDAGPVFTNKPAAPPAPPAPSDIGAVPTAKPVMPPSASAPTDTGAIPTDKPVAPPANAAPSEVGATPTDTPEMPPFNPAPSQVSGPPEGEQHPTPGAGKDHGPALEAAPLKKARRARNHRRRMVQHNVRK